MNSATASHAKLMFIWLPTTTHNSVSESLLSGRIPKPVVMAYIFCSQMYMFTFSHVKTYIVCFTTSPILGSSADFINGGFIFSPKSLKKCYIAVVPDTVPAGTIAPTGTFMCAHQTIWADPAPGCMAHVQCRPQRVAHGRTLPWACGTCWCRPWAWGTWAAPTPGVWHMLMPARGAYVVPAPGMWSAPKGWGPLL